MGRTQPERALLYRESTGYGGQQMIRVGDWKLVRQNLISNPKKAVAPTTQLFNLGDDAGEDHDVAATHPDLVAKLRRLMREQHTPSKEFPFPALDQDSPL